MGIKDLYDYLQADDLSKIPQNEKPLFFQVFQEYIAIRQTYDYKYDLEDLALYVRDELDRDNSGRMYKHIIIDEGQDLSPTMLQSLIKAIPTDGSLTISVM